MTHTEVSSNRRLSEKKREKAVRILFARNLPGFGPTLATEYLSKRHGLKIGLALRKLMMAAQLWQGRISLGWVKAGASPRVDRNLLGLPPHLTRMLVLSERYELGVPQVIIRVHITNSTCAARTGFSHNVECRTMPYAFWGIQFWKRLRAVARVWP